ncbi:MAG: hypothetical protein HN826_08575 [Methylococcales bacterium]|nr:hypothetical protein [Methylococcales bacterium]
MTLVSGALLATTGQALATNGYMLHGFGKNKALGGSGSANPQDALAVANNPAGMVFVGNRSDVTAEIFLPYRGYKFKTQTEVESESHMFGLFDGYFVIPAMGFNWMMNENTSIGYALYGAGLGTDYNENDTTSLNTNGLTILKDCGQNGQLCQNTATNLNSIDGDSSTNNFQVVNDELVYKPSQPVKGTYADGPTGIDLLLLLNNFSIAHKISNNLSLGAGFIIAAQSFKSKGLLLFKELSQEPDKVNSKGRDWAFGYGMNMGMLFKPVEDVTLSFSYQTEIELQHKEYTGLFADAGRLNFPQNANFGVAFHTSDTSVFTFDVQWINWSGVPSIGNKFSSSNESQGGFNVSNLGSTPGSVGVAEFNAMGSENGAGFGWKDSTVFKLGLQWKFSEESDAIFRVGYSHQDQIVPGSETLMGLLAPGVIQDHYTAGFTYDISDESEFTFNFFYAPRAEVEGQPVSFSQGVEYIYLEEYGFEFAFALKSK